MTSPQQWRRWSTCATLQAGLGKGACAFRRFHAASAPASLISQPHGLHSAVQSLPFWSSRFFSNAHAMQAANRALCAVPWGDCEKPSTATFRLAACPCPASGAPCIAVIDVGSERHLSSTEEIEALIVAVCSPLVEDASLRVCVPTMVAVAVRALQEVCSEHLEHMDLSPLEKVKVVESASHGPDFMVPYQCGWEANGAALHIVTPPFSTLPEAHAAHMQRPDGHGHLSAGHTHALCVFEALSTPMHEGVHLLQHLHGGFTDSCAASMAAEHDASRLNFLLLQHALQTRHAQDALGGLPWMRDCIMAFVMQQGSAELRKLQAAAPTEESPHPWEAYRAWVHSFGLQSPHPHWKARPDALVLERSGKVAVAAEAAGAGEVPAEDVGALLRAALHPHRTGDVYSPDNAALLARAVPPHLSLTVDSHVAVDAPHTPPGHEDRVLAALTPVPA